MDNVFTYLIELPTTVKEMVVPCNDGFTVYINSNLSHMEQQMAYLHALKHINEKDFAAYDVQIIELEAHRGE